MSALTAFEAISHTAADAKEAFIKPDFLVSRYLRQSSDSASSPSAVAASHLHGLLSERLELFPEAVTTMAQAVAGLEAAYEQTESAETERQYIIASISLSRARLAAGGYDLAIESVETAIGLLPEATEADAETSLLRAQAQLVKALASHFAQDAETSLQAFDEAKQALEHVQVDNDDRIGRLKTQTTLLLAGVLYSMGGEDQLAAAESQLLER